MDWTPDQIRAFAETLQDRADCDRLAELTPRTARLVAEALRRYSVEAFGLRAEMLVVEVADFRHGAGLQVVGEVADVEAARAVFDIMCRREPGSQVTLRKCGWVLGSKRPGEEPGGAEQEQRHVHP